MIFRMSVSISRRYCAGAGALADAAFAQLPECRLPRRRRRRRFRRRQTQDWVPVPPRPWQWIVIHHSATPYGNAQIIDGWHREKGWDELGYHFVIDNGNGGADGRVEVGPRWTKQKWGAHTKTTDNRFNDFGIGICLVGNFDVDHPSEAQMRSLANLVAFLMKTYHIPAERVLGHSDAKPTDCPGRFMNVAEVRQRASQLLAGERDISPALRGESRRGAEMLK